MKKMNSMRPVVVVAALFSSWGLASACESFKSCEEAGICSEDGDTGGGVGAAGGAGVAGGGAVECQPNETRTIACGLNDAGSQEQSCEGSAWSAPGACDDPDECETGSEGTVACGRDELGEAPRACVAGQWQEGLCRHPDFTVSAGGTRTCAIREEGRVYCWGTGILGVEDQPTPTYNSPVATGFSGAVQVSSGALHTCALSSAGEVYCWGLGVNGRIGNGDPENANAPTPQKVKDLENVIWISAGNHHSCAVQRGGRVYCWGDGSQGGLGNGDPDSADSNVPVRVADLDDAVAVSAGTQFACALRENGKVSCWGEGRYGRLGNGHNTNASSNVPVEVKNLEGAVGIAAGINHACAVRESGRIFCWGSGSGGKLGNGHADNADSNVPVQVKDLADASVVGAGSGYSCALQQGGRTWCWGFGANGKLGNGDAGNGDSNVPVPVANLTDAVTVTVGTSHGCLLRANQQLLCWGAGSSGVLGNGGVADRNVPTSVVFLEE